MFNPEQWRVTFVKVRPRLIGLVVFTIGLILGLAWAYGVAPTIWTNAEPIHLHPDYQSEWVKMVADQYALTNDSNHAGNMLLAMGDAVSTINEAVAANSQDRQLVGRLNAVLSVAQGVGADANNPALEKIDYGGLQTLSPIVLVILVAVLGFILIMLHGMYGTMLSFILPAINPFRRRPGQSKDESAPTSSVEAQRREAAKQAEAARAAAASQQQQGPPPVAQFMSTYVTGDDYFDDSFSIEDASGGFLGETGAGISETIGVGSPKKVTAVEIWLFDKNDIRTVTKVLMTEHAYNDQALREKLAPKGEAAVATPGGQIRLETQTLIVVGTIRDMEYGSGATPPNSFFERLTIDIAAYAKEGATSAPGTAIGDAYNQGTVPLQ